MCTIRHFPNLIEHCIEWGLLAFNDIFVDIPNNAGLFLEKPDQFVADQKKDTNIDQVNKILEGIKKLVELKKTADFSICIQIARDYFEEFFNHQILNLLHSFPKDSVDTKGNPFWSGPKRAPDPITFDPSDALHQTFVTATANLIAFNLGIKQNRDALNIA